MSVGVTFLLAVVGLALIMAGSCFYFMFWMKKSTFDMYNDLDEIRATGDPPERWHRRYTARCVRLGRVPPELFERRKKRDLRRLARIVRFCRRTVLMESEEVRQDVLGELSRVRQDWQAREPGDR